MEEGKKRGTKKEQKFGLKEFPRPFIKSGLGNTIADAQERVGFQK